MQPAEIALGIVLAVLILFVVALLVLGPHIAKRLGERNFLSAEIARLKGDGVYLIVLPESTPERDAAEFSDNLRAALEQRSSDAPKIQIVVYLGNLKIITVE